MSFDPFTLFQSGGAGGWYDPSDLSTLFQDSAGTVPVTAAGQPVGRIADKSGNAKHLTQSSAASRPIYDVDGNGPYLSFDGTNDFLAAALAAGLPFDRISAIRQVSWTLQDRIFDAGGSSGRLYQNATTPQLRVYDGGIAQAVQNGALAIGVVGVVTERHIAGASKLAINDGPYASGDAGSLAPTSLVVGATSSGSSAGNFRFYGMLMRAGTMTDEEIASARNWLAQKAGVTFNTRRMARHSCWH